MLTAAQLAEIATRVEKATPGPWIFGHSNTKSVSDAIEYSSKIIRGSAEPDLWCAGVYERDDDPDSDFLFTALTGNGPTSEANADFISHARSDVPTLLAYIAELEKNYTEVMALLGVSGLALAKAQKETEDVRKLFHEASDAAHYTQRKLSEAQARVTELEDLYSRVLQREQRRAGK